MGDKLPPPDDYAGTSPPVTSTSTMDTSGTSWANAPGTMSLERLLPWTPPPGYPPRPRVVEIPEHDLSFTTTVLDNVIGCVYGSHIVTGRIAAYDYNATTRTLKLGVIFSLGEQDSITSLKVNGETTADATWVTSSATHVGDGTTALSSILTGMTNWNTGWNSTWQNLCHAALTINCGSAESPAGGLTITAVLGGRIITDPRDSSTDAYTNPVLVAYDIMTSDEWRGVSTSKVDGTGTWGDVADWCDEVMSDASARYSFNGVITAREPDEALQMVLGHCHAFAYIDNDGKVKLWAEMSPPPITGEWSATASATITEDSTAGAATTEVSAGDYVYVGTYLRRVSSVTNDDTIVLDSAVTVSGVSVRPITGLYIHSHDWAAWPSAREANILETPDKVRARFEDGTNRGSHEVTSTYGSGTEKIVEITLDGCTDAGTATRITETMLKVAWLQPWTWSGVVRPEIGVQLEPGDVVLFDDDVLTMQAARVLPPVVAQPDGTYQIGLREYDPAAYSDTTDTTDTVPSTGATWDTDTVPIHTSIYSIVSGSEVALIRPDSYGRTSVGNTSNPTQLDSSNVRLPNNVPIYGLTTGGSPVEVIKVDTSDRVCVSQSGTDVYMGNIVLAGTLYDNWTSKRIMLRQTVGPFSSYTPCVVLGSTTYDSEVAGYRAYVGASQSATIEAGTTIYLDSANAIVLNNSAKFSGYTTGSSDPTSTNFPSGTWGLYRNTTSGDIFWCTNAGTFVATLLYDAP